LTRRAFPLFFFRVGKMGGGGSYRELLERALKAAEKAEGELRAALERLSKGDEVLALAHAVSAGLIASDAVKVLRELVDVWSAALTREMPPSVLDSALAFNSAGLRGGWDRGWRIGGGS
jgi:hypothetical protein